WNSTSPWNQRSSRHSDRLLVQLVGQQEVGRHTRTRGVQPIPRKSPDKLLLRKSRLAKLLSVIQVLLEFESSVFTQRSLFQTGGTIFIRLVHIFQNVQRFVYIYAFLCAMS